MKFPVAKCWDCGADLTTAEPTEVTYPGNEQALAKCPKCGKLYFMLEVTSPSPPEAEAPVIELEPVAEPAPEPEPEPEPEASEPEPKPERSSRKKA